MTTIDPVILFMLITEYSWSVPGQPKEEYKGWQIIENNLTSEDGGGHYDLILKNIEEGKFYLTTYCDWDIKNTDFNRTTETIGRRCDLSCRLVEVKPTQKTITVYEKAN